MGANRAWAPHTRWTVNEEAIVRTHYPTASLDSIEHMLPGRKRRMIQCKANEMGVIRVKTPKRTPDQARQAKAAGMARKRAADPNVAREKQRQWVAANRERLNATRREWHGIRFFYVRAKAVATVASVLVDTARVENDYLKITGQDSSNFMAVSDGDHGVQQIDGPSAHNPFPRVVRHTLGA